MHSRKSVLWFNNEVWVKKKDPEFDVTMGSYDGGEVCEVCSLYILSLLKERGIFKECGVGMFKDDGPGITEGGGPAAERAKKQVIEVFQQEGLRITADCNLKEVQFLDVCMNLERKEHRPFLKQNAQIRYLPALSNHPECVKRSIKTGVEKRLSAISSNEKCFK